VKTKKGWTPFSPPKINLYRIQREIKKMDTQVQIQQNKINYAKKPNEAHTERRNPASNH
jgi:hypothetical protein